MSGTAWPPALAIVLAIAGEVPALAQETDTEMVAAAVRARGHACERASSAEPDPGHSAPEERAWILTCENARYRVIFKGDTGPVVEELGG